jgi:hypothetical protein
MPSVTYRRFFVSLVLAFLVLLAVAASPARADKCTAAKLKAIGKKEASILSCHAKVVAKGDSSTLAACIQKVEHKYATAFAKAGTCSGERDVCECLAEGCASVARRDLPDAGPSKCEAARLKAAGKKARGKLNCNAKAAANGSPVDSACIQKAETKYQAAFAKTTGCTGDATGVENDVNLRCVSAVGGDPSGGGTVGELCPSHRPSCADGNLVFCGDTSDEAFCAVQCTTMNRICVSVSSGSPGCVVLPRPGRHLS